MLVHHDCATTINMSLEQQFSLEQHVDTALEQRVDEARPWNSFFPTHKALYDLQRVASQCAVSQLTEVRTIFLCIKPRCTPAN